MVYAGNYENPNPGGNKNSNREYHTNPNSGGNKNSNREYHTNPNSGGDATPIVIVMKFRNMQNGSVK